MHSIDSALAIVTAAFRRLPAETVPIDAALDRFMAEDATATADAPPFEQSAMDGYAIRSSDVLGARGDSPVVLRVAGESKAGDPSPPALEQGHAVRIFTGAVVPAGADAVVMQEHVTRDGGSIRIERALREGENVRHRGSDIREGSRILTAGTAIGPAEIGLLAAQRMATVSVHRRPRVAVVTTGSELRPVDAPPEPGTIVNSNAYALAAQITRAGGQPIVLDTAHDDVDAIAARIQAGLANADALVTVGGVSVGEHDLVHAALGKLGIEVALWKVAMKPGKPLTFALAGAVPIVGLPGNPVSASVAFEVFVRPGLRIQLGDRRPFPAPVPAELTRAITRKPGRPELMRATLAPMLDGSHSATPLAQQSSGALSSLATANALLVIPSDTESLPAGSVVRAYPFGPAPGMEAPAGYAGDGG